MKTIERDIMAATHAIEMAEKSISKLIPGEDNVLIRYYASIIEANKKYLESVNKNHHDPI